MIAVIMCGKDNVGTPTLWLSFLRPVLRQLARQHTLPLSLLTFSLDNPSPLTAPNEAQFSHHGTSTSRLHATCHAYRIC